jgi:hypothetical protein
MLNRTETRIAVAATLGPLALIGGLLLTGHRTPADPPAPIIVQPVPVYAPPASAGSPAIAA